MEHVYAGETYIGSLEPYGTRTKVHYADGRKGRTYRSKALAERVLHMHHQESEGRRFMMANHGV